MQGARQRDDIAQCRAGSRGVVHGPHSKHRLRSDGRMGMVPTYRGNWRLLGVDYEAYRVE